MVSQTRKSQNLYKKNQVLLESHSDSKEEANEMRDFDKTDDSLLSKTMVRRWRMPEMNLEEKKIYHP